MARPATITIETIQGPVTFNSNQFVGAVPTRISTPTGPKQVTQIIIAIGVFDGSVADVLRIVAEQLDPRSAIVIPGLEDLLTDRSKV